MYDEGDERADSTEYIAYKANYDRLCDEHVQCVSENPNLVLGKKFGSNDGWNVTSHECELIAAHLDKWLFC